MTASESSLVGIAKQIAKGTPNVTDAAFKYLLFTQGAMGPQNQVLPLDPEVGGGAMIRDMKKTGVTSGGALEIIPRADTLGLMLLGAFGAVTTSADGTGYKHIFKLPADQFQAPYFTLRSSPGSMWGEQLEDNRISQFGLEFKGANFVRGTVGFQGGKPSKVSTALWDAAAKVDGTAPFITPVSSVELPTGSPIKVLSGSFVAGMAIPLEEQWVVGSYYPDAMDITSRSFAVQLAIKITDADLYSKMMYDPDGGTAWTTSLLREGKVKLSFVSDMEYDDGKPFKLEIEANGLDGAAGNVVWSAQPVGLRAGRQVVMAVTGIFLGGTDPITATLYNSTASY
jgi:hypothetical protein